jgi:hypothetical protein
VVVHEFGHHFLSRVSRAERVRLSNLMLSEQGLLRQRHGNIIEEAMQAALGNLVFMRRSLPEHFDDRQAYSFEPRSEYPDAISSLALALEPHVEELLGREGSLQALVERALREQAQLFPALLAHHTRVGVVLGNKDAQRYFRGLFWGVSRWAHGLEELAQFEVTSRSGPALARWVLLTLDDLTQQPELVSRVEVEGLAALASRVRAGRGPGCVQAVRREGGWDVGVIARDRDGMRQLLIAVQRGLRIPDASPWCAPETARRSATEVLGTGALDASGVARLTTSGLDVGSHVISATYAGDTSFAGSSSGTLAQLVDLRGVMITLTASPSPSIYGQPVTFTATAAGSGEAPTGTVTFREENQVLETAPLQGGAASFET